MWDFFLLCWFFSRRQSFPISRETPSTWSAPTVSLRCEACSRDCSSQTKGSTVSSWKSKQTPRRKVGLWPFSSGVPGPATRRWQVRVRLPPGSHWAPGAGRRQPRSTGAGRRCWTLGLSVSRTEWEGDGSYAYWPLTGTFKRECNWLWRSRLVSWTDLFAFWS